MSRGYGGVVVDASLEPGEILGGRFAVIGVLGSGGTATVYLVVDQLRGERVALKVVHAHLSRDPATRRRLQREVAASALVSHEGALVPWDLHELDGRLCLTMPYHPGQTLTEYVGAAGPLAPEKVRALGIRIAEALAAAHRTGLLHRDVTGNNILVEAGGNAMITDFGLSRVESQATRSTGMLGTAGYAAPEVYSGERSDPRTDLYGLGCALYLAATGQTPFGTDSPMAALNRQLAESYTPVRELNPAVPEDLALTIESLLRKSPADRPQGAREVADALGAGVPAGRVVEAPEPRASRHVHLEPGHHSVVIFEREEDRARRRQLRVDAKKERKTFETEVSRRAQELITGVLAYVGIHSADNPTPEDLLVQAVADEAGIETGLAMSPALVQDAFVLVEGVSGPAAVRLAREARTAGFKAESGDSRSPERSVVFDLLQALMIAGWVNTAFVAVYLEGAILLWVAFMVFFTVALGAVRKRKKRLDTTGLPVAYTPDLRRWMKAPQAGRFAVEPEEGAKAPSVQPVSVLEPEKAPSTRGGKLLARVRVQLDGLRSTVDALELPDIARNDLRDTARDLDERAVDLADAIDRIDQELAAGTEDGSWIEPRLKRLTTKQRAGEPVDPAEITRLEKALASQQESEALVGQLDSQLTAATAEMLEIGSTAARVRRQLLSQPEPAKSASEALERLRTEARQADQARRELAGRARARERR
ncbi:MAG: protein kinase [Myxococcota bacterium]